MGLGQSLFLWGGQVINAQGKISSSGSSTPVPPQKPSGNVSASGGIEVSPDCVCASDGPAEASGAVSGPFVLPPPHSVALSTVSDRIMNAAIIFLIKAYFSSRPSFSSRLTCLCLPLQKKLAVFHEFAMLAKYTSAAR